MAAYADQRKTYYDVMITLADKLKLEWQDTIKTSSLDSMQGLGLAYPSWIGSLIVGSSDSLLTIAGPIWR
jgi:hypothetical protein